MARINLGFTLKGLFLPEDAIPVPFLYNPEEITDSKTNVYSDIQVQGLSHPVSHWVAGGKREISFSMIVNRRVPYTNLRLPFISELYVQIIHDLMYPVRKNGYLIAGTPKILFIFGIYFLWIQIDEMSVVKKGFDSILNLEFAEISITAHEVPRAISVNRVNYVGKYL